MHGKGKMLHFCHLLRIEGAVLLLHGEIVDYQSPTPQELAIAKYITRGKIWTSLVAL